MTIRDLLKEGGEFVSALRDLREVVRKSKRSDGKISVDEVPVITAAFIVVVREFVDLIGVGKEVGDELTTLIEAKVQARGK